MYTVAEENLIASVEILSECEFTDDDLLGAPQLQFVPDGPFSGILKINFITEIEGVKGAFKTAHYGYLKLLDPSFSNLHLFPWCMHICIKRVYICQEITCYLIQKNHFSPKKELELIDKELHCYPFANALMKLVYSFMNQEMRSLDLPSIYNSIHVIYQNCSNPDSGDKWNNHGQGTYTRSFHQVH